MDPAKFAAWFDAHAAGLVLYARQWLDRPAAEDVVQEVFVRLLAQDGEPPNVRAWLFLATRHAAIAAARSDRRRQARERTVAGQRSDGAPFHPVHSADDRLDAAAAEAALAGLPPAHREVVFLRIWGGMTLAEVAGVTGSAVSTVYDQYRAALTRVRRILESGASTESREIPCSTHPTTGPSP